MDLNEQEKLQPSHKKEVKKTRLHIVNTYRSDQGEYEVLIKTILYPIMIARILNTLFTFKQNDRPSVVA